MFMRKMATLLMIAVLVAAFSTAAFAGVYDQKCAVCHKTDGKKGMSKMSRDELLKKYKTADEFIKGAKDTKNPLMKTAQGDEKILKDVAEELGLK